MRAASCLAASCLASSCFAASCFAANWRAASWRAASARAASMRAASCRAASRLAAAASAAAASACFSAASCLRRSRSASSAARSRASCSLRMRASSAGSRVDESSDCGLGALAAAFIAGEGKGAEAAATFHLAASGFSTASTVGSGKGGGGAGGTALGSTRALCLAGSAGLLAPAVSAVLGKAGAMAGWASKATTCAVHCEANEGAEAGVPGAGSLAAAGGSAGVSAVGAEAAAGTSTTRSSGTSTLRCSQGKLRPGSPSSALPKARLRSRAWKTREIVSAKAGRRRSALLVRWLGHSYTGTAACRDSAICSSRAGG